MPAASKGVITKRVEAWHAFLGRVLYELADEHNRSPVTLTKEDPDHVWALLAQYVDGKTAEIILNNKPDLYDVLLQAASAYISWAVAVRARGQTPYRNFSLDYPLKLSKEDLKNHLEPPKLPVIPAG
jgi:hypothetical protein